MAISEIFSTLEGYKTNICLDEINDLDVTCKALITRYFHTSSTLGNSAIVKIQAVIDYTYERVNVGNWKEVKPYLRKTMTICSYLKLLAHFKCASDISYPLIKEAFEIIDYGIMFGCPINNEPNLLQNCASYLSSLGIRKNEALIQKTFENSCEVGKIPNNKEYIKVEVLDCPSMEHFYTNYILTQKPVVINNCIKHWPAFTKWKDQNYFIELAGLRTVSVEVGKDYTDSEWTQKLMTIEDFIKNHIYESNGPTGYLAQYQLFQQIPELKNDISEPEYCSFSETNDPVDIMAWYGPKGTLSPLHHDPKKNLLTQVVGTKMIYLFSPMDSEYLYPHEHELLNNTARVDPRNPDLEKYPRYKNASVYFCVLQPGQMLFIPPKWWHFVESLSISFSVSFWWD